MISAKLDIEELLRDQGISVGTIQEGRNAAAMSLVGQLDESQLKQMNDIIDWIYSSFLERVIPVLLAPSSAEQSIAGGWDWVSLLSKMCSP